MPIKLVHITTVPESLGFLRGQVGYAKSRGFEVHAISSPGESLQKFAGDAGVSAHAVEMPRRITPLRDLIAIARVCRVLQVMRPHIVHSHTPKGGLLGTISAWIMRVPVRVYHIHGLPMMTARGHKRVLLRWSEKLACKLAHQVLCVSHSIREVAIAEGLCPASKIKVLLNGSINGVDAQGKFDPHSFGEQARMHILGRYGIPANATVVGFVGRIVRDKGVEDMICAWQILSKEFPDLYMLVVGAFEPQDMVSLETQRILKEDPRIVLTGHVDDVLRQYLAMDIVILPSYREGFPVVAMEASAMELPVVSTEIPGCRDAVMDRVTGTLVPTHDDAALAAAVRRYIITPALCKQHGRAGRERMLREFRQLDISVAAYQEYLRLMVHNGVQRE